MSMASWKSRLRAASCISIPIPRWGRAAGAAVSATDLVLNAGLAHAFCNVRPPGHPAERNRAMGVCLFKHVAAAAAHELERHGLERISIVDFDVHLRNDTEDIFRDDERVLERFRPQRLLVSAGFADHRDDDMATLGPVEADYDWVTQLLVDVAERHTRAASSPCSKTATNCMHWGVASRRPRTLNALSGL